MKHLAPKAYQCEHCGTVLKTEAGAIKHEEKCPKNNVAKMEKVKLQSEFSKELQEIRETSVSIHEVVLRVVELWRKFGVNVNFNSYPSVFSMQVRNTHDSPKGYPRNWESKPGLPKGYPGWQGRWIGTIEIVDPKKLGNHYAYFQDLRGAWGQCGNLEGVTFFKIGCDGGCGGGGGNLSVHEICRIGVELCCILEYLHGFNGNGILHMDIKPDNIMLDINGKVKLIDFDNAVAGNAGVSVDSGSPLYAAPEQYSGEYAVTQSDVYSVGMVILFMVSHGHIKTDKGHNLAGIPRRYSRLYHVIEKSIHHQWGLRYSSVTLLKNELQGIMRRSGGTIEKHSYIVQVAGDKAGIGTTHTVMCMAHFFKKNGISCVVVDRSGNRRVLPPFLKNGLMEDGSYIYKGIRIIPDYNGAISVSVQKTDIILVDSGHSMRELENDKDIMDIAVENYAYIEVCVTGKHICEENKRLRKLKEDRVYMLNLVSATQFYELTDMLKGKKCYREPCIYDWCEDNPIFDETMNDFLQDNLSELWEDCRPDRLKECIGRLYEKISSIRYFKGVKKKKSR
jgi:hypothetical protein